MVRLVRGENRVRTMSDWQPVNTEPIDGRWCGECGGELLPRRRKEGEWLVTYLICQFCGAKRSMLECNALTREHREPVRSG